MTATPRWAAGLATPPWLALREGRVPIVVLAPHGGRRRRAIRRGDSVNDLGTADLGLELAERLGAHAIVNHGLDRNEIDLNRISHLVSRAPEVLGLLAAAVAAAALADDVPLVLFVHGWNMVAPCCDIGIGLRRRGGLLTGRYPTLARSRYDGAIAAIERELQARGVDAAIGRRYTASGRDNAAQLFSGRHGDHDDATVAALARLAAEGRVDAVQLELGIPLRWPGPRREALLDGLTAALSARPALVSPSARPDGIDDATATATPREGWRLAPLHEDPPTEHGIAAAAVQAVVAGDGGVALFAGFERTGARTVASRVCVVSTDGTMMLVVGEGEWDGDETRCAVDGVQWTVEDGGRRVVLVLSGPMIRYRTHDAYLDLEQGLAEADLVEAEARLVFERNDAGEHGRLYGHLRGGELALDVDATAFVDFAPRRRIAAADRTRLLAVRSPHGVSILRSDGGTALEWHRDASGAAFIRPGDVGSALREAEVLASVPVWRALGDAVFSRWTFGIVRCRFEDGDAVQDAVGLFDRLEILAPGGRTPT